MKGRKFAAFDIDGTLIRWQLYHAIADTLVKLGFVPADRFKSITDARMVWKRRETADSYKAYELVLIRLYDEILANITVEQFEKAAEAVFREYKDQVYTYTRDYLRRLKKDGYLLFAISGSQAVIISKIAQYYGFDDFVAREEETKVNRFTGKGTTPVFNKDEVLTELAKKHGAGFAGSIGVGDSTTDMKMLKIVENPIAFNPEKALFKVAKKEGWKIVIERKNMTYELERKDGRYQLVKAG